MAYQKQITAGRGSNTEPGITKPVAPFHHSHRIVNSNRQSSPEAKKEWEKERKKERKKMFASGFRIAFLEVIFQLVVN